MCFGAKCPLPSAGSRLSASRRFVSGLGASRRFSFGSGRIRQEPAARAARRIPARSRGSADTGALARLGGYRRARAARLMTETGVTGSLCSN
jgi:hypothetical protein